MEETKIILVEVTETQYGYLKAISDWTGQTISEVLLSEVLWEEVEQTVSNWFLKE